MSFFSGFFKGKKENDLKSSATGASTGSKVTAKKQQGAAYESYACMHGDYVHFFVAKSMQSINSPRAKIEFQKGLQCFEQIKPVEAAVAFQEASKELPDCFEIQNNLEVALYFRHRHEKEKQESIINEFNLALKVRPDSAEAHTNLGNVYEWNINDKPDYGTCAINEYRKSIELKPDCAEMHNNLGKILGDTITEKMESIEELLTSIRLKPTLAEAYSNIGSFLNHWPKEQANQLDYVAFQLSEILSFNNPAEIWMRAMEKAISINCKLAVPYMHIHSYYSNKINPLLILSGATQITQESLAFNANKAKEAYENFAKNFHNLYWKS
jgi:Tfp pilus assembly protein PilF